MTNKSDRFYFDNLVQAAECAEKAAEYLVECLEQYDGKQIKEKLVRMHEFEHEGDQHRHDMLTALAKAFVIPVDREVSFSYPQVGDKKKGRLLRNHH